MNERIEQLAEQAEEYALNEIQKSQNPNFSLAYKQMYDKKFAELIVRECYGEVLCQLSDYSPSSNEQYNSGHENGLKLAVSKIKQHFGVE